MKVFKRWWKSPWVPTLTGSFPNGQVSAGSCLNIKNALYYCEFFSWVCTRRLLSHHSCRVRSTDESKNVSDAISRSNSICTEKILFLTNHNVLSQIIESLRCSGHKKVQKAIAWQGKTTTLHVHHAFLYISLLSLHDYHVKMPNFTFCEGQKQAMTKFYFSLWLDMVDGNSAPEEFACIWQSKRVGIITIETEKMWIPFSMRCFCSCQPSWYLLKTP